MGRLGGRILGQAKRDADQQDYTTIIGGVGGNRDQIHRRIGKQLLTIHGIKLHRAHGKAGRRRYVVLLKESAR